MKGAQSQRIRAIFWENEAVPRAHLLDQVSSPKMAENRLPKSQKLFLILSLSLSVCMPDHRRRPRLRRGAAPLRSAAAAGPPS